MSSRVSHSKAQAAWRAQLKDFTWGQCFLINGPMTSNEWTNEILKFHLTGKQYILRNTLILNYTCTVWCMLKTKSASSISRYTQQTWTHTHSQFDHSLIVLACYRLWITLGKHAQIHTPTERERKRELSEEACSWSVNISSRHLKSPSQIRGAYYTPLSPNHTTHRDFHHPGCILHQAAR